MFNSFIQAIKNHVMGVQNQENQNQENNIHMDDYKTRDCVIYIRVSSNEQNTDAQKYTCEEYCFNNRLYIKNIYTENLYGKFNYRHKLLFKSTFFLTSPSDAFIQKYVYRYILLYFL